MSYQSAFFTVPSRILNLPGLTLAFLRIFETIYQFWEHDKDCYLSNPSIMERINCKSDSTVREAFLFFEKHGELKRKIINGRRYLMRPEKQIEIIKQKKIVDKSKKSSTKNYQGVDLATVGRRQRDGVGVDLATVTNNKKYNNIRERENEVFTRFDLQTNYTPDWDDHEIGKKYEIDMKSTWDMFVLNLKRKNKFTFGREDWKIWLKREINFNKNKKYNKKQETCYASVENQSTSYKPLN